MMTFCFVRVILPGNILFKEINKSAEMYTYVSNWMGATLTLALQSLTDLLYIPVLLIH